jgi:DNA invertase Pin-like site-specific DNA recombinase
MAMRYGYTRVSTAKQDCSNQIDALKAAGCATIFTERVSAKSTNNRTEFKRLMRALKSGDTVVVTKLDRLARSSRDLHNILHDLEEGACGFVSLGETWCDTTTDVGKLVLTIMGGIAEFERKLIQARCEEGIAKARENGKKFGRPSALDAGQRRKIADRYASGETMAELAREYEVGEATIFRALKAA